jgi:hypothetical protein
VGVVMGAHRYNVLIIGAGNKGALSDSEENRHKYLSFAHAVYDSKDFNLAGFMDVDKEKQRKAEDIWGARFIAQEVAVVIVATDDFNHNAGIYQALSYNPALIIVEKPLCQPHQLNCLRIDLSDVKTPIMVDYTRRYIPYWREKIASVKAGAFGEFIGGYLYFNRGLYHTASHFVDMCLWAGLTEKDLQKIKIFKVPANYQWVFDWKLFYETTFIGETGTDIKENKVSTIYDNHTKKVLDNALGVLTGKQSVYCDLSDGIAALNLSTELVIKEVKDE